MIGIHTGNPKSKTYTLPLQPVRFPRDNNPLYPLPADYGSLSADGQRQARVNAMCLRETAEDRVVAWCCLRDWYLLKMPSGAWYKPPHYPDSALHYALMHDLHAFPRSCQGFPRSFGKSVKIDEFLGLNMLTHPYFTASLVKSNLTFAQSAVLHLKTLFTYEGVIEDFGRLEPRKGHGKWSDQYLKLANGATLVASSVMSPQLGHHPNCWIIDDAEFDPKMRVAPHLLTENLMALMQEQLIPQLDEGCSGHFIGTLNTVRMLIYRYARTSVQEEPKLAYWHRVVYGAYDEHGNLTWSQKFGDERLAALREELGETGFNAAMLNQPSTDQNRLLTLHPKLSNYAFEDADEFLRTEPLKSKATLVSWKAKGKPKDDKPQEVEVVRRPFNDVLMNSYRVLLIDPAKTQTALSDYTAMIVVCREKGQVYTDDLWVVDILLDRLDRNQIIEKAWEIGSKWRVRAIGIEDRGEFQHNLAERMASEFRERSEDLGWSPRVFPITYKGAGQLDKGSRIADALIWRFEQHRIHLPHEHRHTGAWKQLFFQIVNFTQDLKLLPHDDAVDSLAMFHYVIKLPGSYSGGNAGPDLTDLSSLLKAGEYLIPGTRIPILAVLPAAQITRELRKADDHARPRRRTRSTLPGRMMG